MRRTPRWIAAVLLVALSVFARASAAPPPPLTIDELFPERSFLGKTARALAWSHDDPFVAFLWNEFDDKGADLWLFDTKDGKRRRLTSLATFLPFDRELAAIRDRYDKERAEQERRRTLSFAERNRLDEDDRRKREELKEPPKEYVGVSEFAWANRSDALLFVYKGDLFRLDRTSGAAATPLRLTDTRDSEAGVRWSKDDTGFFFQRGGGVYRARFDAPLVRQLNPELPNNLRMNDFQLSPDESTLVVQASRRVGPPERQVSYISYRERFAQAKTTARDVGDDSEKNENLLFCCDLDLSNPKNDGKPWEVYKRPDGEAGDLSLAEKAFSPDGKRFVFAAWSRDKRELTLRIADVEARTVKTVLTETASGEHRSPSLSRPFYAPDGKSICLMLEKSGYRHAWLLDPLTEGVTPLTRGDFEAYPLRFADDGKSLLVRSDKEDTARMDLYRVAIPSGEMTRLTQKAGHWRDFELAHHSDRFAANFSAWDTLTELSVGEKPVTESHAPEARERMLRRTPERFTFTNRHGMAVQGAIVLPPGFQKGQRRPLLVYVYGGPLGETKQVMNGNIDRFATYVAETLGYAYAIIDPRGSSGYGAVFGKANYEKPGVAQVEDLTDGVAFLRERYGLDAQKVGIHGWSFGGFQTQMCLYTAPDIFTLGIAGAGPTEWQNYNNWYVGGVIGAGKKAEELDRYSLTKLAKNLKSPLMLLHGLEDTNVLAQDTIHVYRELLKAGKGPLVELVLDPTGGHGLGGDIKTKDRYAIYAGFLERRWGRFSSSVAHR
jgi:dipeptidyl aminopeptidase/acylaminoacyl peptidase